MEGRMRHGVAGLLMLLLVLESIAHAHHSHPDFDLSRRVSVIGKIEEILFKNPHTMIRLRTDDGTLYTVEWQAAISLRSRPQQVLPVAMPVTNDTLRIGDRISVTGFLPKNHERHELALIVDVHRPSDRWQWACDIPARRIRCSY
jgi:hypothetical protein